MHKLGTTSRSYETVNQFRTQNAQLDLLLDADNAEADAVARAMRDAGTALARHIMTTLQALNPEAVCLTGPLGRHDAYSQAFRSALTAMGLDSRIILASETEIITPAMASVYLALSDMVYSPQFNFSRISDVDRVEAASR
jgi:predicted NBD/HSP70 family sugar kinase